MSPDTRKAVPVGIGMTLHNRAGHLREAVDSLLAQSYANFKLVLVDDGSTDETETIARSCERSDERVEYIRLPERRGMVSAWRDRIRTGNFEWRPVFRVGERPRQMASAMARSTLLSVLQESPTVVLTYPLTQRIDPGGASLAKPARQFETFGVADLDARWTRFNRSDTVAAGDIVYGLMRTEAARAAGIFRSVLCPDRLLIAELTLQGEIRQIPEVLWYRRQFAAGSIERQRLTLFAPGTQPPSRFTPPWYMHARSLWDTYGRASHPRVVLPRGTIARLIVAICGCVRVAALCQVQRAAGHPRGARVAAMDL